MRLKHINQLKKCVRTYQNVNVFKFHMGDGDYSSVWSMPERDYDPVDRISQILFDLSIKGRTLTTCSIQDNILLGKKMFVIGSSRTKDYSTNIDADLVEFFVNQVKERQRRDAMQREMAKDMPQDTLQRSSNVV